MNLQISTPSTIVTSLRDHASRRLYPQDGLSDYSRRTLTILRERMNNSGTYGLSHTKQRMVIQRSTIDEKPDNPVDMKRITAYKRFTVSSPIRRVKSHLG
jgi:hypothetical protein